MNLLSDTKEISSARFKIFFLLLGSLVLCSKAQAMMEPSLTNAKNNPNVNPLYEEPNTEVVGNPQLFFINDPTLNDALLKDILQKKDSQSCITELILNKCPLLTSKSLQFIPLLKNLRSIKMQNMKGLPGETTEKWETTAVENELNDKSTFRALSQINLSYNKGLSCSDLGILQHMPALTNVNLSHCANLEEVPPKLGNQLRQLQHLNMSQCPSLAAHAPRALAGLTSITHLNLSYCLKLTDQSLKPLKALVQLQELSLSGCPLLTGAGLDGMMLNTLTKLSLANCLGIGRGDGLAKNAYPEKDKRIIDLDADKNNTPPLTPAHQRALEVRNQLISQAVPGYLLGFQNLTVLNFSNCQNLTVEDLVQLLKLPGLKRLYLAECYRMDPHFLVLLKDQPQRPSPLTFLCLDGNATLSGESIKNFLCNPGNILPRNLKTLECQECPQLKPLDVGALRDANPSCLISHGFTRTSSSEAHTKREPAYTCSPLSKHVFCARKHERSPKYRNLRRATRSHSHTAKNTSEQITARASDPH